jgi:hypothetical protein
MTSILSTVERCAFLVLIIATLAVGFFQGSLRQNSRLVNSVLQSTPEKKTPLVANGKRFEAEPGSSLIAVRNCDLIILSDQSKLFVVYHLFNIIILIFTGLYEIGIKSSYKMQKGKH